ncbi:MAG: hypothetical protein JNJ99_03235 [Crocinitomicaceae bacterium]|nr:hypothetical protein [Crocinitomicaceae bacterium]
MKLTYSIIIGTILFSCADNQMPSSEMNSQNPQHQQEDTLNNALLSDTITYKHPSEFILCDTNLIASLIQTGTFHDGEFIEEFTSKKWTGLFKGSEGYFLEPAKVEYERVNDAILDDENSKTGWQVSTTNSEMCVALLSGINFKSQKIESVAFQNNILMPGDSISFEFNDAHYTLFATGTSMTNPYSSDTRIAENYSLFISAVKNDILITELLFSHDNFDENMSFIEFIGDIDTDGFPDLIINTTRHYNTSNPTLFLSSPAGKNNLLKVAGWFTTNGC